MSYIGSTPTTQNFIAGTDSFNGTGSATNFTLSRFVNSVNDIQVVVNNVVQYPPNYSVSGNTLTISPAPSSGTNNVYVRYLSTTLQSLTPSQGLSQQFGIGSAALPSISFIGDTNTGIYSPAADTLGFVCNGTEEFRVDSTGQLWNTVESEVGTDYTTLYKGYLCRAWVNFNGTGTVAIRASGNVSSITDNGTGDYTVNFTTAMPDANYSTLATTNQNAVGNPTNFSIGYPDNNSTILYSTTQVRLQAKFSTSSAIDTTTVSVAIFR